MSRSVAHYPPREIAILGLLEAVVSFAAICLVASLAESGVIRAHDLPTVLSGHVAVSIAATIILTIIAVTIGLYRPDVWADRRRLIAAGGFATLVFALLLVMSCVARSRPNAAHLLLAAELLTGWSAVILAIRGVHAITMRRLSPTRRIVLVGGTSISGSLLGRLKGTSGRCFESVVLPEQDLCWASLRQHGIWAVVVASPTRDAVADALLDCKMRGMRVLSACSFYEHYVGRVSLDRLATHDLLAGPGIRAGHGLGVIKRTTDILLSLAILMLTWPLMLLTAAAIMLDSPGGVLYRQERAGLFGRPFMVLKFRSMVMDAESGGAPRWAQKRDTRVTRVGRFIRATRIDELPQLFNVLAGDMSLVGPRPERPHFVAQLEQAIPFYQQRSYVKPGLTGWAQVNFPYGASIEDAREKLSYDLYYVRNQSFILDMMVLFATIRVVLNREGAR